MTSLVFNQLMLFQFFMPYVNATRLAVFVLLGKKNCIIGFEREQSFWQFDDLAILDLQD